MVFGQFVVSSFFFQNAGIFFQTIWETEEEAFNYSRWMATMRVQIKGLEELFLPVRVSSAMPSKPKDRSLFHVFDILFTRPKKPNSHRG